LENFAKKIKVVVTNMFSVQQVFAPLTAIAQSFYGAFFKSIPAICHLLTQFA
jgi:transaldolase